MFARPRARAPRLGARPGEGQRERRLFFPRRLRQDSGATVVASALRPPRAAAVLWESGRAGWRGSRCRQSGARRGGGGRGEGGGGGRSGGSRRSSSLLPSAVAVDHLQVFGGTGCSEWEIEKAPLTPLFLLRKRER